MQAISQSTLPIHKEELGFLAFRQTEVLQAEQDKRLRRSKMYQAMILGNAYRSKCRIAFETENGLFTVETTIWAATDNYVVLKGGRTIPVCCIHSITM